LSRNTIKRLYLQPVRREKGGKSTMSQVKPFKSLNQQTYCVICVRNANLVLTYGNNAYCAFDSIKIRIPVTKCLIHFQKLCYFVVYSLSFLNLYGNNTLYNGRKFCSLRSEVIRL
jgi:hypothetical protein